MRLREIIGHGPQADLFRRLLLAGRLPPSLVIAGQPGVGRRTLARAIAQAHLCDEPQQGDACGFCESCRLIADANHPDMTELPNAMTARTLKVETVREAIVAPAQESAFRGNGRVFIIPDCERLAGPGANALLKILEEPPAGVIFILTTDRADGLLDTIRSRSQVYRLQGLSVEDLSLVLQRRGVEAGDALARARLGNGSHRGLWDHSPPPVPLDHLRQLLLRGFQAELVADLMYQLESQSKDVPKDSSPAAEQRKVLGWWLDALLQELRAGLRGLDASVSAAAIQKVLQLRGDLQRYLQPRLILEALGL